MTARQSSEDSSNRIRVKVRVIGPRDGDILGAATAVRDRFMIDGQDSGGGFITGRTPDASSGFGGAAAPSQSGG